MSGVGVAGAGGSETGSGCGEAAGPRSQPPIFRKRDGRADWGAAAAVGACDRLRRVRARIPNARFRQTLRGNDSLFSPRCPGGNLDGGPALLGLHFPRKAVVFERLRL
jgi:hypothetical protein